MQTEKTAFPEELRLQFRNVVNARCGLYFRDYDLNDLDKAVAQRMKALGIESPAAYYNLLIFSDKKEDEFRELLNILTIKHTYFFRNEPQFKVLKERIIPEIMERRFRDTQDAQRTTHNGSKPTIRIWSAGCSTGEEPYTIAMVVREAVPDLENWDVQIVATDASTEALEGARRGVYGANSMRLVDAERRGRYFREHRGRAAEARFEISDEIKRMVRFSFFNLMDDDYPGDFDVIFCRNVVIYFELDTTIRVMKKFSSSLRDDGYLFIGYSESLQFISEHFRMLDWEDAIYYVKTAGPVERPRPRFLFMPAKEETDAARSAIEAREAVAEVSKAEVKAEIKAEERVEPAKRKRPPKLMELLVEATKAAHMKHYDAALSFAGEAARADDTAAEPYYIKAEIFVNQGRVNDAKENLRAALEKDMMFAPAHYLAGSIYAQEGNPEEAMKSLRKALYLDDGFSLAHFSLANIYRDSGRAQGALREYRNTLSLLSKANLYDIVPYSGGFNTATLASVCKSNIERLKSV